MTVATGGTGHKDGVARAQAVAAVADGMAAQLNSVSITKRNETF